jgi:GNAT superfamily N-acetyltransferase
VGFADTNAPSVTWVAPTDAPNLRAHALVRARIDAPELGALAERLALVAASPAIAGGTRWRGFVAMVEQEAVADVLEPALRGAGLQREDLDFFAGRASSMAAFGAQGGAPKLTLEPMVGDSAWRAWGRVERVILAEMVAPAQLPDAMLDRALLLKRRQQRESPPVRRFVARDEQGALVGMIGYAPFGACDLGLGAPGVLARLRDVAVLPDSRRRGVGSALVAAVARAAIDESGASQILICGAGNARIRGLYRKLGARVIGGCVMFGGATTSERRG